MGRKSSAKTRQPQPPGSPPPPEPARSVSPLVVGALVVIVLGLAAIAYRVSRGPVPQTGAPGEPVSADAGAAARPVPDVPPNAKYGPHKQETLPPLPVGGLVPARPVEVLTEVYRFAAEHPEVLGYVPCYCGCERSGHNGNDDCFVASRAANGDVTAWDSHGVT